MICRAIRLATLVKPAYDKLQYPVIMGRLSTNSVFHFAEEKKQSPIKSHGIKPIDASQTDNSIEAEMDPLKPKEGEKPLDEG